MVSYGKTDTKYVIITMLKVAVACFVGAFSFYKLTVQAGLIPGGFTGIGAIIEIRTGGTLFGLRILTAGIIGLAINVPFYIMSYKYINKRFFWYSLYGMLMFSLMAELVGRVLPEGTWDIKFDTHDLAPLLYAIVAGVASGASGGYIMRLGFSTGGSEMVSFLVGKRMPFVKAGTVSNALKVFTIVLYALLVKTENLAERIVLSLLSGFITSYMYDVLIDGFKAAKAYYIISSVSEEMSAAILEGLNRSSTMFSGEGSRLHKEQKMLMCIVYNHEVAKLRAIVHKVDRKAFMFSTMVKEAYGTDFSEQAAPVKLFHANRRVASPTTKGSQFASSEESKNIVRQVTLRDIIPAFDATVQTGTGAKKETDNNIKPTIDNSIIDDNTKK